MRWIGGTHGVRMSPSIQQYHRPSTEKERRRNFRLRTWNNVDSCGVRLCSESRALAHRVYNVLRVCDMNLQLTLVLQYQLCGICFRTELSVLLYFWSTKADFTRHQMICLVFEIYHRLWFTHLRFKHLQYANVNSTDIKMILQSNRACKQSI